MPRRRFSRIKDARRLAPAFEAYKAWQDRDATYTPRPAGSRPGGFQAIQVRPFGLDVTDPVRCKVSQRAFAAVNSIIGARGVEATPTADIIGGFSPAKAIIFIATGSEVETTSEITRLRYQKRQGASYTHAFGGSTATEKEFTAQAEILTAAATSTNRTVSFQPERLYQY